ncbi:MAG TPA: hypothetical protein VF407_21245, partial [Polyangiaceae bacterium]
MRIRPLASLIVLVVGVLLSSVDARAQQPQPYPPQQYPQQYPPQQYPQQYPPQQYPQQYPPQQYPQQYPPQQYPQQYPPQQQQPYPGYAPGYVPQPTPPPASTKRAPNEMVALYGTSLLWGVGTGIWLDSLAKIDDPGI